MTVAVEPEKIQEQPAKLRVPSDTTGNRWIQLVAGVIAMIVISNYQYAFTLFTPGMKQTFVGVPYARIALIFAIFIGFETWPMPVSGYFIDKFGIRRLMTVGALLILAGWALGGTLGTSPAHLYIYYGIIAGTGCGTIYISCVANALKWFPDRRGLAAGLTAAGFGGGAALTVIPVAHTIRTMGWSKAMLVWGIAQGLVALIMAMILRHPPAGWAPAGWTAKPKGSVVQSKVNYTWSQMLARPEFYLLYAMFIFANLGGLMATANLSQIAKSLSVNNAILFGTAIVPLTVTLTSICNALSRIAWGSVSDRLGRELTMFLVFGIEAILVLTVTKIAGHPLAFFILFPLIFLFWGEIYSLFSATCGDAFGPKNASVNYGLLYTSKGVAAYFAGYGSAVLAAHFAGSFAAGFYISAILCGLASLLALFLLRPLLRQRISKEHLNESVPLVDTREKAVHA
ncbi:MAG TPA: oxalate/formate MFS antiporter [Candidatus Eremiobacteraceae bacterium]|nr:oxalate/formate MFS antiporter [Candidatus Eremiobacteraceae bacterium]